jgi:hypothetical protein
MCSQQCLHVHCPAFRINTRCAELLFLLLLPLLLLLLLSSVPCRRQAFLLGCDCPLAG